jgi:Tol biopolymer transport system component
VVATAVAAVVALPTPASAVLSGENGRIVFTSGRGEASDNTARLYLRPVPFSTGGGTTSPTITPGAGLGQHRHPTWSPDRTMVAYAAGGACPGDCDIFVRDLTNPGSAPQNITNTADVNEDRAAWSPDGTRIAFESEVTNGSGQLDVLVDSQPFGSGTNLNLTSSADTDGKPAWTPNSQTLFYARDLAGGGVDNDVVQEPAGGGTVTPIITGGTDDYQPSVSPDGQQLCFVRGAFGTNDAEVFTANSNGTGVTLFSFDDNVGSYNCTWSPDGDLIAYVNGTFTNGDLVIQDDAQPTGFPLPIETTSMRFDGNPDWAPDGRPSCEDTTVTTDSNTPVTISVTCPDTGPAYERSQVSGIIDTPVSNGTTSPGGDDPAFPFPANVTYTPNQGFTGTDTFTTLAFDEFGFADRQGTITIHVRAARTISFDATKAKKKKQAGKEPRLAVRKGKKAQFSGDVSAPQNVAACEANQPVELQRKKPTQTTFTTFEQLQTDAAGNFSTKEKIKKTFEWRAVVGETQACEDATSNSEKVKAKKKKK